MFLMRHLSGDDNGGHWINKKSAKLNTPGGGKAHSDNADII